MSRDTYIWICTATQLVNVVALIRMGAMHHDIARGDWSHPVSKLHLVFLVGSAIINSGGAFALSIWAGRQP